jgi:PAS domain S-box-containing protein
MSTSTERCVKSTLHGTGDGAFAAASDGRIIVWNPAAERLLGYTEREAVGRRCWDLVCGDDGEGRRVCNADCHVLAHVSRDEPVRGFDVCSRTKGGRPIWLGMSVVAVPGGGKESSCTVHLMRDITGMRELLALAQERTAATAPEKPVDHGPAPELSLRQRQILRLLTEGLNTARVAERLHVSGATVRNHVQSIFAKLGVHSRLEAVAYAARHRLF